MTDLSSQLAQRIRERVRERLDITGHLEGFALRLDGEVLTSGTLTHCARVRAEVLEGLSDDRL